MVNEHVARHDTIWELMHRRHLLNVAITLGVLIKIDSGSAQRKWVLQMSTVHLQQSQGCFKLGASWSQIWGWMAGRVKRRPQS